MISAIRLKELRQETGPHPYDEDWMLSERLKLHFASARERRHPMFLTKDEFFEVAHWKLGSQYGRAARLLEANTPDQIERVTAHAFSFSMPKDPDLELDVRVQDLRALAGVGMGVGSALLALCFSETYSAIDFRVWRQLFGEDLSTFEPPEYRRYMGRLRELVGELRGVDPAGDWNVQLVDYYCWENDKREQP